MEGEVEDAVVMEVVMEINQEGEEETEAEAVVLVDVFVMTPQVVRIGDLVAQSIVMMNGVVSHMSNVNVYTIYAIICVIVKITTIETMGVVVKFNKCNIMMMARFLHRFSCLHAQIVIIHLMHLNLIQCVEVLEELGMLSLLKIMEIMDDSLGADGGCTE